MKTKACLRKAAWMGLLVVIIPMTSCQTTGSAESSSPNAGTTEAGENSQASVDIAFLLSMTYEEAKSMGKQSLDMAPYCRLVADRITVLSQTDAGVPLRVRATGKVYLEQPLGEGFVVLGHEAYIDRGFEIMMRGRPLLRRGSSVVEGLDESTVFYMRNTRLQVVGNHRVPSKFETPPEAMIASNSPRRASPSATFATSWDVTPTWRTTWEQGPNPLLPALSPDDIPANMRPTPLLPPLSEEAQPRLPGEGVEGSQALGDVDRRKLGQRPDEEASLGRRRNR